MTSFWRYNDVIITPSVPWEGAEPEAPLRNKFAVIIIIIIIIIIAGHLFHIDIKFLIRMNNEERG